MPENPLDNARGLALAEELRFTIGQLSRRLREQGLTGDLTWPQVSTLTRLERDGPAGVSDLARAEGVRPQSMGATVASLQEAGLLVGNADPNDGRRTLLSLSPACRQMLAQSRERRADWLLQSLRANFPVAEYDAVEKAVGILKRLAGN